MFTLFDDQSAGRAVPVRAEMALALSAAVTVGTPRLIVTARDPSAAGRSFADGSFRPPAPAGGLVPHPRRWQAAQLQRLRFRGTQPSALRGRTRSAGRRFQEPRPDWPGTAGLRNRRRGHPLGARHLLHRR